jgi:hypothetical protein
MVRVLQRIFALTAAIWHNDRIGQPTMRSLIVKGVKTRPYALTCGFADERVLGQPALSYSLIRPARPWWSFAEWVLLVLFDPG